MWHVSQVVFSSLYFIDDWLIIDLMRQELKRKVKVLNEIWKWLLGVLGWYWLLMYSRDNWWLKLVEIWNLKVRYKILLQIDLKHLSQNWPDNSNGQL